MTTREEIFASIAAVSSGDLANRLLEEYDELANRFSVADFRPSELSGARFSEAAFRVCQEVCCGKHTPVGRRLPNIDGLVRDLEQTPASKVDDGFRIHIPRTLRVIYDLRNKRDVVHLGEGVSPNLPDATLVLMCASWVMAEVVRISHQCSIEEAQRIVDNLVERQTPLIWTEDDVIRVLKPELVYRDKVLLVLHHLQPERVDERVLFEAVEYSSLSAFRRNVLQRLHDEALIDFRDGAARILPPGNEYVVSAAF
ncbi:MAG: hypothetical protein WD646_15985 [Actinomycetota bacterium]